MALVALLAIGFIHILPPSEMTFSYWAASWPLLFPPYWSELCPLKPTEKVWSLDSLLQHSPQMSQSYALSNKKRPANIFQWISLMVRWLGLCAPNAGSPGSIPSQGTRSRMPQLKKKKKKKEKGASLVAQWLRICLPMQGTRV